MAQSAQPREITGSSTRMDIARSRADRLLDQAGAGATTIAPSRGSARTPSLEWARSGRDGTLGRAAGRPRLAAGPLASAARGAGLAIAALSQQASHANRDWGALLGERAALFGFTRRGTRSCGGHARLLEGGDGWLAVHLPRPDDWRSVPAWLETEAPRSLDAANTLGDREAEPGAWAEVADAIRTRPTNELVDRARLLGIAAAEAPKIIPCDRPAWRLDAQTERLPRTRPVSEERPLRVLDLSTLWAGPLATSLLAESGADVVKVESPARPDGAREGETRFFALMNADKSSAALDLRDATDRARFEALLDHADVVVESARPRALAQLGYDATGWARARAGRLWVSITGYGRDHEWIAFGDDAAIAAGLAWSRDAATPSFCGDAIADPLTGLHAAALILAHRRAGRGGLLALSLRDVVADCARDPDPTAAEACVVRDDETGEWVVRSGDERAVVAAPRARPVAGAAPPMLPPSREIFTRWTADS